jgi:hypothetical protein
VIIEMKEDYAAFFGDVGEKGMGVDLRVSVWEQSCWGEARLGEMKKAWEITLTFLRSSAYETFTAAASGSL